AGYGPPRRTARPWSRHSALRLREEEVAAPWGTRAAREDGCLPGRLAGPINDPAGPEGTRALRAAPRGYPPPDANATASLVRAGKECQLWSAVACHRFD